MANQITSAFGRRYRPNYEGLIEAKVGKLPSIHAAMNVDELTKKQLALQEQQLAQDTQAQGQELSLAQQMLGLDQAQIEQLMQNAEDQNSASLMKLGLKGGMGLAEHGGKLNDYTLGLFGTPEETKDASAAMNIFRDGPPSTKDPFTLLHSGDAATPGVPNAPSIPDILGADPMAFDPGAADKISLPTGESFSLLGSSTPEQAAATSSTGEVQSYLGLDKASPSGSSYTATSGASTGQGMTTAPSTLGLDAGTGTASTAQAASTLPTGVSNLGAVSIPLGGESTLFAPVSRGVAEKTQQYALTDYSTAQLKGIGDPASSTTGTSSQLLGLTSGAEKTMGGDIASLAAAEKAMSNADKASSIGSGLAAAGSGLAGGFLGNLLGTELTGDPKGGSALGGITGTLAAIAAGGGPLSLLGLAAFPVMEIFDSIFGSDDPAQGEYNAMINSSNVQARQNPTGNYYAYKYSSDNPAPEGAEILKNMGPKPFVSEGEYVGESNGAVFAPMSSPYNNVLLGAYDYGDGGNHNYFLSSTPLEGYGDGLKMGQYYYNTGRGQAYPEYVSTGVYTAADAAAEQASSKASAQAKQGEVAKLQAALLAQQKIAQDQNAYYSLGLTGSTPQTVSVAEPAGLPVPELKKKKTAEEDLLNAMLGRKY